MTFRTTEGGDLEIGGMQPALMVLLNLLPDAAGSGGEEAERRLYPEPCGSEEREIREDWETLVKPSLRHLFESARETVRGDLAGMREEGGGGQRGWRLVIPRGHFAAWLNCLNQARLAIAARIHYTEEDQAREPRPGPPTEREMRIFQMDFYAVIQEWLLRAMSGGGDGGEDEGEAEG